MKEVTFWLKSGGKRLNGILHYPDDKKNSPLIIMCHGWTGGKWGNPYFFFVKAARYFCKKGFAVMRFDHSGVGDSEGNIEDYTTTSSIREIEDAIRLARTMGWKAGKIGLLGHSMGGMNAVIAAQRSKDIGCVVSWAGVANHEMMWADWELEEIKRRKFIWLWGFKLSWKTLKEDFKWDTLKFARKSKTPTLVINGDADETVRSSQAFALHGALRGSKKIFIVRGADHGFNSEEHQGIIFRESLAWFRRWLK